MVKQIITYLILKINYNNFIPVGCLLINCVPLPKYTLFHIVDVYMYNIGYKLYNV